VGACSTCDNLATTLLQAAFLLKWQILCFNFGDVGSGLGELEVPSEQQW
jgi:hypothetical protein